MAFGCTDSGDLAASHVLAQLRMQTVLESRLSDVTLLRATVPSKSAASWSAIIAGAFVAPAVSIVLLTLGTGLDLAAVSSRRHLSGTY